MPKYRNRSPHVMRSDGEGGVSVADQDWPRDTASVDTTAATAGARELNWDGRGSMRRTG